MAKKKIDTENAKKLRASRMKTGHRNVTLILDDKDILILDAIAKAEKRTRSSLMRKLLIESIEQHHSEYLPTQNDLFQIKVGD